MESRCIKQLFPLTEFSPQNSFIQQVLILRSPLFWLHAGLRAALAPPAPLRTREAPSEPHKPVDTSQADGGQWLQVQSSLPLAATPGKPLKSPMSQVSCTWGVSWRTPAGNPCSVVNFSHVRAPGVLWGCSGETDSETRTSSLAPPQP